jgi:hypothetical protein
MDDRRLKLIERNARKALRKQAEALEHIRNCSRCERLFVASYGSHVENEQLDRERLEIPGPLALGVPVSKIWLITHELLRDLRRCKDWPEAI